ncbi:PrgI family protein [bacterium]|nr:MAG: PrgI family protein [bacterium]
MRYQLPQFIEMEDKLIGPFSLKQFLYLIFVPAFCWGIHYFVRTPYVILVGIIFFPIALLLAFYQPNGRPFIDAIRGLLRYIRRPQMYVWKRIVQIQNNTQIKTKKDTEQTQRRTIGKKVKNFKKLAETLDKGKS